MTNFYDGPDMEAAVLEAVKAAGLDASALDSDDLAGMDEFHALGRAGTLAQANLAELQPGERIVDVGAGIAGPSRTLARHFGVHVTALEPTARSCTTRCRGRTGRRRASWSTATNCAPSSPRRRSRRASGSWARTRSAR